MKTPIALQLFTLRDALAVDREATLRRVAEIGYQGVEPFGLTPELARSDAQLLDELGLAVPSVHVPVPVGEHQADVLRIAEAVGCKRMVCGYGRDEFTTLDGVRRCCERFNQAYAFAAKNGYGLGIHNHWWEYGLVEGQYPYRLMLDLLDPAIVFEVDVYWAATAGADVLSVLREFGARAPLLHVKDGPATLEGTMVALGEGRLDIPAIVAAGGTNTEWLIVELDRCDTDMMTAVETSYRFLQQLERAKL